MHYFVVVFPAIVNTASGLLYLNKTMYYVIAKIQQISLIHPEHLILTDM